MTVPSVALCTSVGIGRFGVNGSGRCCGSVADTGNRTIRPDVDVLDFDWNDHTSRVSTARVVAVVSYVRCSFDGNQLVEAVPIQIASITLIPSA